jgi:hypothetical protein
VLLRAERALRLPLFGARQVSRRPVLAGTEYRSQQFVHGSEGAATQSEAFAVATVPCPHADRCALVSVCPGEHYAVYQSLFGLDEYDPVSVAELYGMSPHPMVAGRFEG